MANIKDVAKIAGCSISTVSYALNDDKRIPEVTALRIKKIANDIGYLPSAAARNLKKKNTRTVLVAISDFGGPVYHELLDGIHYELTKHSYTMIVSTGSSTDNLLKERMADGTIISDINISNQTLKQISKILKPIIILDRKLDNTDLVDMTIDNYDAMYRLTEDVIIKGYRKIAFCHGVKKTHDNEYRFKGFKDALENRNLEIFAEYVGNFTKISGTIIAEELIKSNQLPEMIVCANDEMAIGIMEVLQTEGYEIPKNIGVSGFDDIELASYFSPKLSSVRINRFEWGRKVAKTMLSLLTKEKIVVKKEHGELKIRDSY
ncbi:MAG: LacI family DNA-binding transcriptional regulator [Candidatus Izemoplasmatales bacterium]|nr:LacI family DNA-binding transcriptional regulator [Candidatus Izemoplasmatales bacterium]